MATQQYFSHMLTMASWRAVNPTYNGIAVSVWYVSSTVQVDDLAEVKHRHESPVSNLDYAQVNKSIIYVAMH